MKVRIFALAKELGLDSKVLIQRCSEVGVEVKNSALASITPEERDRVLAHLKSHENTVAAAPSAALNVPVREAAGDLGRVREIKTMGPLGRMRRKGLEDEETPAPSPAPPEEVAPPAFEPGPAEELVAQDVAPPAGEQVSGPDETGGTGKVRPITREDYVPPVASGGSGFREMKPVASIQESGPRSSRRQQKKPALPNVAAPPTYRPPVPRAAKGEAPAQKPDMPLTADILKQASPLANIIRKNAEGRKRGPVTEEEESDSRGARQGRIGLDDVRQQRRTRRQRVQTSEDDVVTPAIARRTGRRQRRVAPVELKSSATIDFPITVRSLSEEMGRPAKDIMRILFQTGKMCNINSELNEEEALEVALELGVELEIRRGRDIEQELTARLESPELPEDVEVSPRPPVVTILGHVDHGKTTLVDTIRSANVAAGEAGGITQHIAAYQVDRGGQKITFVDTPGHAAFGEMRARGANVTDIVVLVVAADDGVMPQTVECISHAKAAGVPLIVAMNKMDLPGVNEQRVLTELSQRDVLPAEWGGDVEVVRVSALEGTGVDNLLDTILLTAELHELTAPVNVPAVGICLEAFRDEGRGPVAWVIVRSGELRVGDVVLCGSAYGRIRAMYNDRDEEVDVAPPSTPVKIAGLDRIPGAGDHFYVMEDIDAAREAAEQRQDVGRDAALSRRGGPRTLEDILSRSAKVGGVQELPLIIKADTPGSIEALRNELQKFQHPEVRVNILHEGVGGVNESDVYLASSSGAIIVAFHVVPDDQAVTLAAHEKVQIRRYNIIYEVTDDMRLALEGLLRPERVEVSTGRALVLRTFHISRLGTIAGCRVLNGTIDRKSRVHVIREQTILNDYPIASLKREKDDAKEVREGFECGIRLDGFNDLKEGDLLEAYRIDEIKRTLDS